ncbi:hypothetical protein BH11ARM2_BH11ARM2_28280 [soil metagenome]
MAINPQLEREINALSDAQKFELRTKLNALISADHLEDDAATNSGEKSYSAVGIVATHHSGRQVGPFHPLRAILNDLASLREKTYRDGSAVQILREIREIG